MKAAILLVFLICALYFTGIHAYSVSGSQLLGPDGKAVLLRGIDRPSLEWQADGQYLSQTDYGRMKNDWNANAIRLSLNQAFWLSNTQSYRDTVDRQVQWIKGFGMGVILDLHWSDKGVTGSTAGQQCMADANSVTFWKQVATKYKNDPWIIFELYNEPHDVSWSVWLNGGSGCGFDVKGMQDLYNAVRDTGANNVVIVNGLSYAFDLTGVRQHTVVGDNIVYGTHPYDFEGKGPGSWDSSFGYLTDNYPVIATEFGQYCHDNDYVERLLNYFEDNKIHWTAWGWWVQNCEFPSIISDWSGTPAGALGRMVKNALLSNRQSSNGPAATVSPSVAPSTGSRPAAADMVVYTDSLQSGWSSYGWATDLTYSATAYKRGSNSISFSPSSYAGVYAHTSSPFVVTGYQSLQFYLNGGASSGQVLKVVLYDNSPSPAAIGSQPVVVAERNTWTLQTIPISSFGVENGAVVSGVAIAGTNGGNQHMVYIDDISFVAPATTAAATQPSTAPTTKSTTTPTTQPTTAPTTKATTTPTTKSTTNTPVNPTTTPTAKSTTRPTTTPVAYTTGVSATLNVVVNAGTNSWWIALNSVGGAPFTTQSIQLKDSSAGATWQIFTQQDWGYAYSPSQPLVLPISLKITTTNNYVTVIDDVITSLNGQTYTVTAQYLPSN